MHDPEMKVEEEIYEEIPDFLYAPKAAQIANFLGWALVAAAVTKVSVIWVFLRLILSAPEVSLPLLMVILPVWLMETIGGMALIWMKRWGFYVVYTGVILSCFLGGASFVQGFVFFPFADLMLEKMFDLGAAKNEVFRWVNLTIAAGLAVNHFLWCRALTNAKPLRNLKITFAFGLPVLVACLWMTRTYIHNGTVEDLRQLPVVGEAFAGVKTIGPVDIHGTEHFRPRGVIMVLSGTMDKAQLDQLAARHKLTEIDDPEYRKKMIKLLSAWKLSAERFPSEFLKEDRFYSGRIQGFGKTVLQFCWRRTDGRFTAQLMGTSRSSKKENGGRPKG